MGVGLHTCTCILALQKYDACPKAPRCELFELKNLFNACQNIAHDRNKTTMIESYDFF